ncbi:NAD-dependent epimerase/dehydratase family protein [Kribbella sp. NPDC051586]|uniref:NAD-dependent epimerase/dehydratase family protein n=1 Tax=Kribbella sp. NPDC051586 TaxID=3364118 RepID=UPI0037A7C228
MRIWVSGARGKLGAEVCRQLVAGGHEVIEADLSGPGPVDLMDRDAVARSMRGAEAIVHCAGIASPENIEPVRLFELNALTTFNALEEAWKLGIRTAVLASSGSIYGTAWSPEEIGTPDVPVDEDTDLRYVDPYALTKDVLERMGQLYARRGVQVTALRFHWILTPDEVRRYIADAPPKDNRRNLWGYVDLAEAARACVLSLEPRTHDRFATLVIAAEDTGRHEPTAALLARYSPQTRIHTELAGTTSLFDSSRAAAVINWTHHTTWRNQ